MGDKKYSFGILLLVLQVLGGGGGSFSSGPSCLALDAGGQVDIIETITFKDADGIEHEEYAFREPARGLPNHVLDMYCSSVRVRLYWDVLRDEIRDPARKGIYLRRMGRLAKHIFEELRDVDKPFNATQLSVVDDYFGVKLESAEDKKLDEIIDHETTPSQRSKSQDPETTNDDGASGQQHSFKVLKGLKEKITKRLSPADKSTKQQQVEPAAAAAAAPATETAVAADQSQQDQLSPSELINALESQGSAGEVATSRLKQFLTKLTFKKVALGVYTRWRTMWWMMMSCLFTKYYLWDPALDEFLKLKRTLLMWPELQLAKLHELKCKPLVFFRRVMDICKILNPLMRIDFGQFNLEKLTRFKSDQN